MKNITLFLFVWLVVFLAGCGKESSVEPEPPYYLAENSASIGTQDYAHAHNSEVQRLLLLDRDTGCLKRHFEAEFETLLQEINQRNPEMAGTRKQFLDSQEILPNLINLHNRGHRPLEIFGLLQHCWKNYTRQHAVHPEIQTGLNSAVRYLLARDTNHLSACLLELQILTDKVGNTEEKCMVGVFLGSFEYSMQTRREVWYWPWIVVYDYIGSIVGGANIAALFSGWAEIVFQDFPSPLYP